MARIFTTGAEEHDTNALWDAMDLVLGDNNPDAQSHFLGPIGVGTKVPRTGIGMYALTSEKLLRKDFGSDTSKTELYFGMAVNVPSWAANQFLIVYTDSPGVYANYLGVRSNATTGAIEVTRSGTQIATSVNGVVSINTWQYYEFWFKPRNASGRVVVKLDGVTIIDFTGDTTNDLELINAWQIDGNAVNADTMFDDIVVNDTSGASNTSYPGMVRLLPIRPASPGTNSAWTRAGVDLGSDEAQLRNGSYEFAMLQTSSADQLQDAIPEVPDLPVGATITNVVLSARAKVDAGAGVIAPMVIANGTSNISADQTLVSAWRYYQYAWALNPEDSAAWAEADLALLKIGVSS